MKSAEVVMDEFMIKLNNGDFKKDVCRQIDEGFEPNKETVGQTLLRYEKTLEALKNI